MSTAGDETASDLASLLGGSAPFDKLGPSGLTSLARTARRVDYQAGQVVLDAFVAPSREMGVVVDGQVTVRSSPEGGPDAGQRLGPGGVFGFSAMLSQQPVGPRVLAAGPVTVAWLPEEAVLPAFATAEGARYLAVEGAAARFQEANAPGFTLVQELIARPPLVLPADTSVREVARAMTEQGTEYAAFALDPAQGGGYGLLTDRLLRTRVLQQGRPDDTPAREVLDPEPPTAQATDSTTEAMIALLDHGDDVVLVLAPDGTLRGALCPRDFARSPTTAGVALHEQLRLADSADDLVDRARRMPAVLDDLLTHGLAAPKVIAVYCAMIDTTIRRALRLTLRDRPELDEDAFTWLSLGSNGRREAVPSSDVDSAVSFAGGKHTEEHLQRYRQAFAELSALLDGAGLSSDPHGATASRSAFSRTASQWRKAAKGWLSDPVANQGALMASLMVDGRPIHGARGATEVARVFRTLRTHPETMRLLLRESLSVRAKQRSITDILSRRRVRFDVKNHALLPIVNIARWAALTVGSPALATVDRLRAASGSAMLPADRTETLIEVFEVLQGLRLECQLGQLRQGRRATDVLDLRELSPLDRTVVAEAVREIAAVQRRMDNVSLYVEPSQWTGPPG